MPDWPLAKKAGQVLRRRWPLVVLAAGAPMAEAIALRAAGQASSLGLAPQVSAPAPFGLFHDLRWVLIFHQSWLAYALEMAALLIFRMAMTAGLILAAWPAGEPRPRHRRLLLTAALYVLTGIILLSWPNALLFMEAITPLSWIFFAAIAFLLLLGLVYHQAALLPDWWRRLPSLGAIGWMVLTFLMLSVDAVVITMAPPGVDVLVAGAAGLFNAFAWYGLIVEIVLRGKPHGYGFLQGALAGFAGLLIVWGGSFYGVARNDAAALHAAATALPLDGGRPIIGVSGFRSSWSNRPTDRAFSYLEGYRFEPFSYAGLDVGGHPLPYGPEATYASLEASDRLLDRQVRQLAAAAGRRVALVAASEGSLVAVRYLLTTPDAPVDELILLSPILEPGRAYYPPPGRQGWGQAAAWEAQAATRTVTLLMFPISPETPFIRSVVDDAPLLRQGMACPIAGVRETAFLPLASAADLLPAIPHIPTAIIPGFHGYLYQQGEVRDVIRLALAGRRPPDFPAWGLADEVVRRAASAWQEPELPLSFFPVERRQPARPAVGCAGG